MATRQNSNPVMLGICRHLASYSTHHFKKTNVQNSRDQILKLSDQIKKDHLPPSGRRLTRHPFDSPSHRIGNLSLQYDYKRDKLTTQLVHKENFGIYFQASQKNRFFLLNSGQAAIFLSLHWLTQNAFEKSIATLGWTYVGTTELQSELKFKFRRTRQTHLKSLWICSAYFKPEYLRRLRSFKKVERLFIDTTCWPMESPELKSILKIFPKSLIFVIRSHSKLDMAGIEYGSLGSLLVLGPGGKDPKIQSALEQTIKLCGLTPSLDDIPPYLFSKEFYRLNSRRIQNLRNGCDQYKQVLKKNKVIDLVFPHHGTYFFLKLPFTYTPSQVQSLMHFVVVAARKQKIQIAKVPSFGFNFLSFNYYQDMNTQEHILRFCPSSIQSENQKFAKILNEMIVGLE